MITTKSRFLLRAGQAFFFPVFIKAVIEEAILNRRQALGIGVAISADGDKQHALAFVVPESPLQFTYCQAPVLEADQGHPSEVTCLWCRALMKIKPLDMTYYERVQN